MCDVQIYPFSGAKTNLPTYREWGGGEVLKTTSKQGSEGGFAFPLSPSFRRAPLSLRVGAVFKPASSRRLEH